MKIERTNNNLFAQAQKSQTDMKRIKEVLGQIGDIKEPVQITISKEGYESYRNSLAGLEGYVSQPMPDTEIVNIWAKSVVGDTETRIRFELERLGQEIFRKAETRDTDAVASSFFTAYASIYDKICKEYEDGTRNIWECHSTNGNIDYRQLTKEEELSALESAYEKVTDSLKNFFEEKESESVREMDKRLRDEWRQMELLKRNKEPLNEKKEEEDIKLTLKPEEIKQNMKSARLEFQSKYSVFYNQTQFLNQLSDIINQFFTTGKERILKYGI